MGTYANGFQNKSNRQLDVASTLKTPTILGQETEKHKNHDFK
jgi:hypothetical protein